MGSWCFRWDACVCWSWVKNPHKFVYIISTCKHTREFKRFPYLLIWCPDAQAWRYFQHFSFYQNEQPTLTIFHIIYFLFMSPWLICPLIQLHQIIYITIESIRKKVTTIYTSSFYWENIPQGALRFWLVWPLENDTYLGLTPKEGGKGKALNLQVKQPTKFAIITKQMQMANKADS